LAGWDALHSIVRDEITQRREEGCDVAGAEEKLRAAGEDENKLMALYADLMALDVASDWPFVEPNDLEAIRAERPEGPRRLPASLSEAQWRDKFHGAWLGRSVGCALGKPLEAPAFLFGTDGSPGWRNVRLWFEGADAWPIKGYTPLRSRAAEEHGLELASFALESTSDRIRFMESDDDIRYTVLGLKLLEEKGLDWDAWDVGKFWHKHLSYAQVCTAETQSYLNFARVTNHMQAERPADWKAKLEWVRHYVNPYREWIGAQIRADGFAYGVAGRPELAAELAWRDASFSHVKNGIYGEMFAAAMIAAAFAESDPERIVEIGLSEIPQRSRLAHDVRKAVSIAKAARTQEELVANIWEAFKHYNPVHTNNNAALVAASLVFAQGDFETAVVTSVLGGWDTDCNGATVGSIMGAMLGASGVPDNWAGPLNDTLYAEVHGFHPIAISACASRSYDVFAKLSKTLEASK